MAFSKKPLQVPHFRPNEMTLFVTIIAFCCLFLIIDPTNGGLFGGNTPDSDYQTSTAYVYIPQTNEKSCDVSDSDGDGFGTSNHVVVYQAEEVVDSKPLGDAEPYNSYCKYTLSYQFFPDGSSPTFSVNGSKHIALDDEDKSTGISVKNYLLSTENRVAGK